MTQDEAREMLLRMMEERNVNQRELARRMGMSYQNVWAYLRGPIPLTLPMLSRMLAALTGRQGDVYGAMFRAYRVRTKVAAPVE